MLAASIQLSVAARLAIAHLPYPAVLPDSTAEIRNSARAGQLGNANDGNAASVGAAKMAFPLGLGLAALRQFRGGAGRAGKAVPALASRRRGLLTGASGVRHPCRSCS